MPAWESDALIVDAVRSPIGRKNGTLSKIRGDELSAQVLNGLLERNGGRPRRGRGRAVGLRHPDRGAGVEHRPQRRPDRRLARLGRGHDGRPAVRVLDADELQRGRRRLVGPGGPGRLGRRRDDVARPDGLEQRLDVGQGARPLPDRDAGDLVRPDRREVGALARAAGRVRLRVAHAGGARDRRGAVRARDRADRPDEPARRLHLRHRRGGAPRHDAREDGRAAGGLHAAGPDDRRGTRRRSSTARPPC